MGRNPRPQGGQAVAISVSLRLATGSNTMLRFAILIHDHPSIHWDFLLEHGDHCRSWRMPTDPTSIKTCEITAEGLPDHRTLYLDYEGPVSGGRGSVIRHDSGTFEWRINQPDLCEVELAGTKWRGVIRLERIKDQKWKAACEASI